MLQWISFFDIFILFFHGVEAYSPNWNRSDTLSLYSCAAVMWTRSAIASLDGRRYKTANGMSSSSISKEVGCLCVVSASLTRANGTSSSLSSSSSSSDPLLCVRSGDRVLTLDETDIKVCFGSLTRCGAGAWHPNGAMDVLRVLNQTGSVGLADEKDVERCMVEKRNEKSKEWKRMKKKKKPPFMGSDDPRFFICFDDF
ncbi:hypothetical protein BC940DRAFT_291148 [Gongronella butleri]|nr:hypothetical protein BC940DRAFT_291148 [Gongronella butleri]